MCMKANRCILYFHSIHSSKTVYKTSKTTIFQSLISARSTTTVVKHMQHQKTISNHHKPTTRSQTTVVKPKQKYNKNLSTRTSKGVSRRRTNLARSGLTSWFEMSQGA